MSTIDQLTGVTVPGLSDDYEVFQVFSEDILARLHFNMMKSNVITKGIDTFSHDVDDVFAWTDVQFFEARSGKTLTAAKSISHEEKKIEVRDGYFILIELPATISENEDITLLAESSIPREDYRKLVIGYRSGSVIYFKNGTKVNV